MISKDKKTKELWLNMEQAYKNFHEAVSSFIHNAEYTVENVNRDLNGKVTSALIDLPDGGRIFFRCDEWDVMLPVKDNPVNTSMLEKWEKEQIDWEIQYHTKQLEDLIHRKQELNIS